MTLRKINPNFAEALEEAIEEDYNKELQMKTYEMMHKLRLKATKTLETMLDEATPEEVRKLLLDMLDETKTKGH